MVLGHKPSDIMRWGKLHLLTDTTKHTHYASVFPLQMSKRFPKKQLVILALVAIVGLFAVRDVISLKQLREWLQSNITFTLVNEMTVTKDANKDYTRVAWTSPNTSGVISPLMALNDDPLFKRLLSASD